MYIFTAKELVSKCLDTAKNYKTLYVMGCFGAPMTAGNKARYTKNHTFNAKPERTAKIMAASEDTFGFDCVCFIKALLWGWNGDKSQVYGGAVYKSNGVPDINANSMIKVCEDVSTDFSKIQTGEAVWMEGHIGVYIGDGLAVECTPRWDDCVQITAVGNIGKKNGYNTRTWTKHGKLPYVKYVEEPEEPVEDGKLYRVTVEGLPKKFADTLAQTYADTGYAVSVEEIPHPVVENPWVPDVGDIVNFTSSTHYSSSQSTDPKKCAAGQAKITVIAEGSKHPYHLVRTGKTGPYGWVDAGTFTKA